MNLQNFAFRMRARTGRELSFVCRFVIFFCLLAISQIGTIEPASAQKWDVFPYKSQYSKNIQTQWKRIGCYSGKIDGKFGKGSLAAKDRWFAKLGGTAPGWVFNSRESVLTFLKEQPANFCDKSITTSKVCRRLEIGRNFLKNRNVTHKPVQELENPLTYTIDNFDGIFSATAVPVTGASTKANRLLLEKYGVAGISRDSTLQALELASKRFKSLIFQYGYEPAGPCGVCYMINNWTYLSNFAQSQGGKLYSPNDARANFKVADITVDMMHAIKDHILLYRRMSAKWLTLVDEGLNEYTVNVTDPADTAKTIEHTIKIDDLQDERRKMLETMIVKLLAIKFGQETPARHANGSMSVTKLAKQYKCIDFDGSSVYAEQ